MKCDDVADCHDEKDNIGNQQLECKGWLVGDGWTFKLVDIG